MVHEQLNDIQIPDNLAKSAYDTIGEALNDIQDRLKQASLSTLKKADLNDQAAMSKALAKDEIYKKACLAIEGFQSNPTLMGVLMELGYDETLNLVISSVQGLFQSSEEKIQEHIQKLQESQDATHEFLQNLAIANPQDEEETYAQVQAGHDLRDSFKDKSAQERQAIKEMVQERGQQIPLIKIIESEAKTGFTEGIKELELAINIFRMIPVMHTEPEDVASFVQSKINQDSENQTPPSDFEL